jgi:glycosyltransferase involved in cell wall biosynthesis
MPKVSIITPCYNSARYVGATIESVRAQTLKDWQQVVVDDGSSDESAEVVEGYRKLEPRLSLVRQPNGGVANARNNGYRAVNADSRYLLFLDGDDCIEPQMLETMTDYLDARPEVGLAYCDVRLIDEQGQVLKVKPCEVGWASAYVPAGVGVRALPNDCPETPFAALFGGMTIIPSISILRHSVYAATPGFDETFGHVFEDLDLFLQMALRAKVHRVAQPLVRYRRHGTQSTANVDRYGRQERKLYEKWRTLQGLAPEHQQVVQAAIRFREGRLLPYLGVRSGWRHLRQGRLGVAARFYAGSLRGYLRSFLPRTA